MEIMINCDITIYYTTIKMGIISGVFLGLLLNITIC